MIAKKVWYITGAARGMGVKMTKAIQLKAQIDAHRDLSASLAIGEPAPLLPAEGGPARLDRLGAREAEDEGHAAVHQSGDGGPAGEATIGHDASEATAEQPAEVAGQERHQLGVALAATRQEIGDDLTRLSIDGQKETIAAQAATVRAGPPLLEVVAFATAPKGNLVSIDRRPDATGAVGEFGYIGGLHRRVHVFSQDSRGEAQDDREADWFPVSKSVFGNGTYTT